MSNQLDKFSKRVARPQTLAGAMGGLLKLFGVRASDADLATRWDEIMGPDIANIAKLAAVRKNRDGKYTIVIRPATPAFALQLSYSAPQITEKLNDYFGRDAVAKITFRK